MSMSRPEPSEYNEYYETYVSKVEGNSGLEQLESQISDVLSALSGLDDERARYRYEPGKWSIKELLGHMVDTERVFAYRAMCLARGEKAPLPGMDQDDYVTGTNFDARSLSSLLEEYEYQRRSTLALLSSLSEEEASRAGVASDVPVSVRALAYIIAGHEAHHLGVLRERYLG